jgi:hypothetical protein
MTSNGNGNGKPHDHDPEPALMEVEHEATKTRSAAHEVAGPAGRHRAGGESRGREGRGARIGVLRTRRFFV